MCSATSPKLYSDVHFHTSESQNDIIYLWAHAHHSAFDFLGKKNSQALLNNRV